MKKTPAWLFVAIAIFVLSTTAIGAIDFVHRWHIHGDSFAQAEGTLLTFIAASVSVLVTLAFIYLTRRSVEVAQNAIVLQRQSLSVAENAIELERQKWDSQLRVEPRFWLALSNDSDRSCPVYYGQGPSGAPITDWAPQIMCYVWNPGQQSFRVSSVNLRLKADRKFNNSEIVPDMVVPPHSVSSVEITKKLIALLFKQMMPQPNYRTNAYINPYAVVTAEVVFDSWSNKAEETSSVEASFRVQTDRGLQELTVQHWTGF